MIRGIGGAVALWFLLAALATAANYDTVTVGTVSGSIDSVGHKSTTIWIIDAIPGSWNQTMPTDDDLWLALSPGDTEIVLLRYDLRAIPDSTRIAHAELRIRATTPPTTGPMIVNVYRMSRAWGVDDTTAGPDGGDSAVDSQATWFHAFAPESSWLAGSFSQADYDTVPLASFTIDTAHAAGHEYSIPLTVAVDRWVRGALANHGLVLIAAPLDDDYAGIASVVNDSVSWRPHLYLVLRRKGLFARRILPFLRILGFHF